MKRMSEVFELPVSVGVDDSVVDASGIYIGDFWTSEMAKITAHAINNCDSLADALEEIIAAYRNDGIYQSDIQHAAFALNTYRGTK